MKVYLRHQEQTEAQILTYCEPQHVSELLERMIECGVYFEDGVYHNVTCQFLLGNGAYLEVVISGEPE